MYHSTNHLHLPLTTHFEAHKTPVCCYTVTLMEAPRSGPFAQTRPYSKKMTERRWKCFLKLQNTFYTEGAAYLGNGCSQRTTGKGTCGLENAEWAPKGSCKQHSTIYQSVVTFSKEYKHLWLKWRKQEIAPQTLCKNAFQHCSKKMRKKIQRTDHIL